MLQATKKTYNFRELLPHRDPMIWVDEILSVEKDCGEAITLLKKDELYFDEGSFYPSAYIEIIAQSYAYVMAINGKEMKKELKGCYLTTIDKMENNFSHELKPGDRLKTVVKTVRNLHPAYVVEGVITDQNNRILCECKLKGFAFFSGEELPPQLQVKETLC